MTNKPKKNPADRKAAAGLIVQTDTDEEISFALEVEGIRVQVTEDHCAMDTIIRNRRNIRAIRDYLNNVLESDYWR